MSEPIFDRCQGIEMKPRPHIASGTRETFKVMEDLVLANLQSYFKVAKLVTPVA